MTQQDIIDELNRMVIGYNIHWNMVKFDADKAIMKINSYLGANYPMMSEVLLSPQHRYTVRYKNIDLPIFPERYILTVVIPYIATEVLARDEEFTTIYNKYAMDVENGLFDMFQNEFNRIPKVFRQDPDVGVYFSKDVPHHKIREDFDKSLPEITYNVYYHYNLDVYQSEKPFTLDPKTYDYGASVVLLEPPFKEFISNIIVYKFEGWMLNPNDTVSYEPGDDVLINCIKSDVHLYAKWTEECVLQNNNGVLSIRSEYKSKVYSLIIPTYVENKLVEVIDTGFADGATNLTSVTLPRLNITIYGDAFTNCPNLEQLILPAYDYLRDTPKNVVLHSYAINCDLPYLYIPYGVSQISPDGIKGVGKIQCEIESQPSQWADGWTDTDVERDDWGVVAHG